MCSKQPWQQPWFRCDLNLGHDHEDIMRKNFDLSWREWTRTIWPSNGSCSQGGSTIASKRTKRTCVHFEKLSMLVEFLGDFVVDMSFDKSCMHCGGAKCCSYLSMKKTPEVRASLGFDSSVPTSARIRRGASFEPSRPLRISRSHDLPNPVLRHSSSSARRAKPRRFNELGSVGFSAVRIRWTLDVSTNETAWNLKYTTLSCGWGCNCTLTGYEGNVQIQRVALHWHFHSRCSKFP